MSNPSLAMLRWGIASSKKKAVEGAVELYGTVSASLKIHRRMGGDDTTWLPITKPFTGTVTGIAYSKTLKRFVMCNGGASQVSRSDDKGVSWTNSGSPVSFKDIIWVEALNSFFAVGGTSCYRSADGITWTAAGSMPTAAAWDNISWSNGYGTGQGRIVITYNSQLSYSDNAGVTFTTAVPLGWGGCSGHAYSPYYDKTFLCRNGTTPSLFTTTDFTTFTLLDSIQAATDIAIGIGFLGIGAADDRIMTCGTSQGRSNSDAAATVFQTNSGAAAAAAICAMKELGRVVIAPSASGKLRESTNGQLYAPNALSPTDVYSCIGYHYGD